jgi:hypothetical protein
MPHWANDLAWLSVGDSQNPFPIEVLDCRAACAALSDISQSEELPNVLAGLGHSEDHDNKQAIVDGLVTECLIETRVTNEISFVEASLDEFDRWRLTKKNGLITATRRWTGQVIHLADYEAAGEFLRIRRLSSQNSFVYRDQRYAVAEFTFLVRTYLERRCGPFPIPRGLMRKDSEKIALVGWKTHGSYARFAAFF